MTIEYFLNRIELICNSHSQPAISRILEIKEWVKEYKNEISEDQL